MLIKEIDDCLTELCTVIKGKNEQVTLALICLLAKGHLLLEDLPGMGKTSLSHALASVLGLAYKRVQFTSDLLPADILGVNIYNSDNQQFSFHAGPIFSQVLLADEINRASPKTQSALLEAMAEQQVSVDGVSHILPSPFFVIATQNPLFQAGTYPLPESQVDRFMMCLTLGYPDFQAEKDMLCQQASEDLVSQQMSASYLLDAQARVKQVKVSEALVHYILNLVRYTRENDEFQHALSPRASKAILRCSQAAAFVQGRDHVIPEDVQMIIPAVTEHRLRGAEPFSREHGSLANKLLSQVDPMAA